MSDFVDSSAFRDDASAKAKGKENRLSLSLSRKKKSQAMSATSPKRSRLSVKQASGNEVALNNTRFEFKKTDSYKEMSVRFVPQNTKKNNNWAYNNFQSWRENRNREFPDEQCPLDLIESPPWDCSALSYWLARFGCETRNALGRKYPATTVFSLLSALLRQMRVIDADCPNFLDTKDTRFQEMHSILDTYFRELRKIGVGADVKQTSLISKDEESTLWEKGVLGVLGIDTPECLLRAVFFYNGKTFCLRGGKEHRALKVSQIVRCYNPDHYIYTENGSKNRSGGFNELRLQNKTVPIFRSSEAGDRCHVSILDKYLSKLPPAAFEKDVFYMKPLGDHIVADPSKPWYGVQPCGENKLSGMVKSMFAMIGVSGKTNHSLCATGASSLFQAGIPEKIIQERTGHRSIKALRMYERTTTSQHVAVSNILSSTTEVNLPQSTAHAHAHAKPVADAGVSFSTMFASASNCVININMATPVPGLETVNTTD